jgi:hypothetical protein
VNSKRSTVAGVVLLIAAGIASGTRAAGPDEFKIKRQEVFEFIEKPIVAREGDKVVITFASKGYCDATVAVENAEGRIVRHLACGVLGPKAPGPFQKDSLRQTVVWDEKNDKGEYVDNQSACTIRVSLGLKPQFERTLFWSPHKRIGISYPVIRAAPEGVYVAEGYAVDHIRLFDHQGNYLRTVYPFPADKVTAVVGLKTHTFAQSGKTLPLKQGYHQATLLTCGSNFKQGSHIHDSSEGYAVSAMAENQGRLALVNCKLNRLATDGSGARMPLEGPATSILIKRDAGGWGHPECVSVPLSAAFSPDGKWLYLAGYQFTALDERQRSWLSGVLRVPYQGEGGPQLFVGNMEPGDSNGGAADGQFRVAPSVACDAKGRVYVADYMNDRIQVFDANAKHLKSVPVSKPACVAVHQKTGDIFVFSWLLQSRLFKVDQTGILPTFTHLGPLEDPRVKCECPLPLVGHTSATAWNRYGGVQHRVELDSWAEKPTVWIVNGRVSEVIGHDDGSIEGIKVSFDGGCVQIYEEVDGKLAAKRSFADDVKKSVQRLVPPILWRQRLYVHPVSGKLYVAEGDSGVMKSVNQLVEIDPGAGTIKLVDLPLGAEDLCFDIDGLVYIRTDPLVTRYDPATWREVPWDYGEEHRNHSFGMGARGADLISALATPGHRSFNFWHQGGLRVSVKGHLVVATCNGSGMSDTPKFQRGEPHFDYAGRPYTPRIFPGRMRWGEIHVWDKHGKLLIEDAVPGMGHLNGIGIDRDDNIYMLSASRRVIDGKPADPQLERDVSGAVVKVPARKAKVLSSSGHGSVPIPLAEDEKPQRSLDLAGYTTGWVEGANWFYGGVGFCTPGACVCWNCRFDLDYFNRSFAPEPLHYSVAVLDSNGNLILRIGKYGNADDGKPLIAEGGPANPRSIGGDEAALFHACYVATHTDRRVFIADAGNARILSVKLGYHAEERTALNDMQDQGAKK